MSKVLWFRSPAEEAAHRIARRLRSEGSIAKLARVAEVPERTAEMWVRHPERMTQLIKVLGLLRAAEVTEDEIARMIRG